MKKQEIESKQLGNKKAKLYVLGTPIGNLEDISSRALRILSDVEIIFTENIKITSKLLHRYSIKTPLRTYRSYKGGVDDKYYVNILKQGHDIALVSAAGLPAISDPGADLIRLIQETEDFLVVAIPGPTAAMTAMSVSGWKSHPCLYLGFLSSKKSRRKKYLNNLKELKDTLIVFYESVHRIKSTLSDLFDIFPEREVLVAREMTKIHEEYVFFKVQGTELKEIEERKKSIDELVLKGEFTVVVNRERHS